MVSGLARLALLLDRYECVCTYSSFVPVPLFRGGSEDHGEYGSILVLFLCLVFVLASDLDLVTLWGWAELNLTLLVLTYG